MSFKENDPDQDDGFGRKLNDLSHEDLLNNAHWAHRLIDAMHAGEFDCPGCGCMTSNGICTGCRHGTSAIKVLTKERDELKKALAMAEKEARVADHSYDLLITYHANNVRCLTMEEAARTLTELAEDDPELSPAKQCAALRGRAKLGSNLVAVEKPVVVQVKAALEFAAGSLSGNPGEAVRAALEALEKIR